MADEHLKYDLEANGDIRDTVPEIKKQQPESNDEYTALVEYISTFRDGRRKSVFSLGPAEEADKATKRPWWSFWRKSGGQNVDQDGFDVPDDWLDTDIQKGLSSTGIESRRKQTGWNELTTEKENLFLKFLGYFTGPILYGKDSYLV